MGYGTRDNGRVKTFWPDDTDKMFYLDSSNYISAEDLLKKIHEKWSPDVDLSLVNISAEYIHTDYIYYNRYDPDDYTKFVVVELQEVEKQS